MAAPAHITKCEVIGIRSNSNGRSCSEHETCGKCVRVGDVLVLRPVEIPKRFGVGMEQAIRAAQFRGDGQQDGCNVGFIATAYRFSTYHWDGLKNKRVIVKQLFSTSENLSVRRRDYQSSGIALCDIQPDEMHSEDIMKKSQQLRDADVLVTANEMRDKVNHARSAFSAAVAAANAVISMYDSSVPAGEKIVAAGGALVTRDSECTYAAAAAVDICCPPPAKPMSERAMRFLEVMERKLKDNEPISEIDIHSLDDKKAKKRKGYKQSDNNLDKESDNHTVVVKKKRGRPCKPIPK